MMPTTRAMLKVMSALIGTFQEKIISSPEKAKNFPKTAKIEGLIHVFGLFEGPSFERHGVPPRDMGGHQKAVK